MPKTKYSLALDIGSTGLRLAEFAYPPEGGFTMLSYETVEYSEHLTDTNRTAIISSALQKALDSGKFTTKRVAVCITGKSAFMRFVKLPPVSEEQGRIQQIVEYEARQNVPFPIDEVIWDYQLIGGEDDELEVMFVVIKNEIVESIITAINDVGLQPHLVDFAPAALYNVARANHLGDNECAMILNIGGRCSNVLFIEGSRLFVRTLPIAGFTITQQIAKEFGISTDEAEILKKRHGFVALGGAYEEPESEVAATISKIVRNVMTRLHGEINRSINIYRTQEKGNKPKVLYLSGGSSIMGFTNEFFQEKLRMEVNYLNPFKIVSLSEDLDIKKLQEVFHIFPEIVGVALRQSVECPVEVSLVPESLVSQAAFASKKPFLVISYILLVFLITIFLVVDYKKTTLYQNTSQRRQDTVNRFKNIKRQIKRADDKRQNLLADYGKIKDMLENRYTWSDFYSALQDAKPIDIWFDYIKPTTPPARRRRADHKQSTADDAVGLGLFGAGGGRGGGGNTANTNKKEKTDNKQWFVIRGHAVSIPKRKIFTREQIKKFNESLAAHQKDADKSEKDAKQKELLSWRPTSYDDERNLVPGDVSLLPEILMKSLNASDYFTPGETKITSFQLDDTWKNYSTFQIKLKLKNPLRIKW